MTSCDNTSSLPVYDQPSEGLKEEAGRVETSRDAGSRSSSDLRLRSIQKLEQAWHAVYEKFRDAHLQQQDEIYLGRRSVKGDRMRIIRDRGHLRGLPKASLQFGCFHIDSAELIGCEDVKKEEPDLEADVLAETATQETEASTTKETAIGERVTWPENDPDLHEFLQAEARRRELIGTDGSGDEEEGNDVFHGGAVFDFGDDRWDKYASLSRKRRRQDSTSDDGLDLYSLALASSSPGHHSITASPPVLMGEAAWSSPQDLHLRRPSTPPTSLASTPTVKSEPRPVSLQSLGTPLPRPKLKRPRTEFKPSSQQRSRKDSIRLPMSLPDASPQPALLSGDNGCLGSGRCMKSLCMLCGGFKQAAGPL